MKPNLQASRIVLLASLCVGVLFLGGCMWLFNTDPIAQFTATPSSGAAPLDVWFDASASFDPDADELSRVLEMMTGMDQWYDATPMAFRAETWDDPDAPVFLETVLARILAAPPGRRLRTAVRVVVEQGFTQTKFSDWLNMFRVLESYGVRPQDHQQTDGSASLADVLNDPFFDEFRPGVLGMGEFEIDFVGDATRRPGDGPGIRLPPGSVPVGPERGRKRQATEEDRSSTKQEQQERR